MKQPLKQLGWWWMPKLHSRNTQGCQNSSPHLQTDRHQETLRRSWTQRLEPAQHFGWWHRSGLLLLSHTTPTKIQSLPSPTTELKNKCCPVPRPNEWLQSHPIPVNPQSSDCQKQTHYYYDSHSCLLPLTFFFLACPTPTITGDSHQMGVPKCQPLP